jgi:hypothetical protein
MDNQITIGASSNKVNFKQSTLSFRSQAKPPLEPLEEDHAPPKKVKRNTNDESQTKNNDRSTKVSQTKSRGFDPDWLTQFDFLYYGTTLNFIQQLKQLQPDVDNQTLTSLLTHDQIGDQSTTMKMFCTLCVRHQKNNTFTAGSERFRKDVIYEHMLIQDHMAAIEAGILSRAFKVTIQKQVEKQEQSLLKQMRLAYYICKENLAIRKYQSLLEVVNLNEGSKTTDLTHFSEKSFRGFLSAFSKTIMREQIIRIRNARFYSILVDESMDVSKSQNLIVYFKYYDLNTSRSLTEFAALKALTRSDAQGIFDTLNEIIKLFDLNFEKLLCLGSDGASVMVGSRMSLLQLLKDRNPFITNVHCINHRLALASRSLIEQIPYLVEYFQIVSDIHNFFSKSSKRCSMLKEFQSTFDEDELRMVRLCPTRWLSLHSCVDHILRGIQSINVALMEEASNKKLAPYERKRLVILMDTICSYKFLATTHFLKDILSLTTMLCKEFQKENCNINDSHTYLMACLKVINEDYITERNYGEKTRRFLEKYRDPEFLPSIYINNVEEGIKESRVFQRVCCLPKSQHRATIWE